MSREITERERSTIVNALHLAASAYADISNSVSDDPVFADQFTRQSKEAKALAEMIENADEITIKEGSA